MGANNLSLQDDYWRDFKFTKEDLEFLYNHLLEIELPQTAEELSKALISNRINQEIQSLINQKPSEGIRYQPGEAYKVTDVLIFPQMNWKKGTVKNVRPSNNPNLTAFDVLSIEFEDGSNRLFAGKLPDHILNQPIKVDESDPAFQPEKVFDQYGETITQVVTTNLEAVPDLVRIAGRWFPRALLVDIGIGHLNLVEAVLDMNNGGPLPARALMEQIELPTDVNSKLTEFSLNLALEEDERFDEVGPAGETLWFLHKLEPDAVKEPPITLRYTVGPTTEPTDDALADQLIKNVVDELEPDSGRMEKPDQVTISLIYPHWRAGTLPITKAIRKLFPAAYEAPRVQFKFIDADTNEEISGWVVRTNKYVYGLQNWYQSLDLIPGNCVTISRGNKPGEVLVSAGKKKSTREWVRTALIGADGGIVFAMLKQLVSGSIDERMAVAIPDVEALDTLWANGNYARQPIDTTLKKVMKEQAKLNPQGHVHAQELYSAVNLIRRCPPRLILGILQNRAWVNHMGDLYFRLNESDDEA